MTRIYMYGALACSVAPLISAANADKPHIVLVLADDYGWANLGVHRRGRSSSRAEQQGAAETHTPNMDQLIGEGILLERHYAYKICSPSRSSLQSGRLPLHVNVENTGVTVQNEEDPVSGYAGIPRNMTGIAQKLKSAGYRTHMVGKWDVGMATPEHTPGGRGYESWIGYFQHANDYWRKGMNMQSTGEVDNCLDKFTDLFQQNASYQGGVRDGISVSAECMSDPESHAGCYEEELFKEHASRIVRDHDLSSPLFLFYSFHLLHTPLQIPQRYLAIIDDLVLSKSSILIDSQNRRLYAAMALYMDEAIGELVMELKTRSMWGNTLLVFTSDNGGPIYEPGSANNYPLKGGKYSDWEGGVRTNAFISGGFIPAFKRGTSFKGVVSIADWFGTLCDLAGIEMTDHAALAANKVLKKRGLPLLPAVDSVPQWAYIMNEQNGRADALHLSTEALLWWPFKLVTGKQVYSVWQGPLYPNCSTVHGYDNDQGPAFEDLKIFDHPVQLGATPAEQDRLTWAQDCKQGCLYNVETDPTEHVDLASDGNYAETLVRLQQKLKELNGPDNVFSPERGQPQVAACDAFIANGGYYGPFVNAEHFYSPLPTPSLKQQALNTAMKVALHLVNNAKVADGTAWLAQQLVPKFRQHFMTGRFDKCFASTTRPDSHDELSLIV